MSGRRAWLRASGVPDASFAGQQDTLLGVRGESAVIAAIWRCWSSLFSEHHF